MRVGNVSMGFPKPRGAVLGLLVATFAIWLILALGVNWGGADSKVAAPLVGSTSGVLHGEVWRLLTAVFVHVWSGPGAVSHVAMTLLVVYFFGPALEERWGWKRFLGFALGAGVFGYVCQTVVGALVPKVGPDMWLGGLGMVDAMVIAWALQADPNQRVLLFFVLPISPKVILIITVAFNVLNVIALGGNTEGLITPFGGMLAGYLLSDRSPLRRTWLKLRLRRVEAQAAALRSSSGKSRVAAHGLRVIRGGGDGDEPPKDKRYLN